MINDCLLRGHYLAAGCYYKDRIAIINLILFVLGRCCPSMKKSSSSNRINDTFDNPLIASK